MRRFLATLLVVTLAAGPAAAAGLTDISGHWAERYIMRENLKGVIAGYEDSTFKPSAPVTRLETVVMLVRSLALGPLAQSRTTIPAGFVEASTVPDWARGYISVAVERGIITGGDLVSFRARDEAKRHEVAVFLIRAMGLAGQAESRAGSVLPFNDAAQIPQTSRNYVALAAEKGLLTGTDGAFRPLATISRAEMATVLARLDDQLNNDLDVLERTGTISSVISGSQPLIVLRQYSGGDLTLRLADGAALFRQSSRIAASSLAAGEAARLLLNVAGEAAFVEAGIATPSIEGTIYALSTGTARTITVKQADGTRIALEVPASTPILVDGVTSDWSALRVSAPVTVDVNGTVATRISAQSIVERVEGELVAAFAGSPSVISVRLAGAQSATNYTLAAGTVILRGGQPASLAALVAGDALVLEVKGNSVLRIEATSSRKDISNAVVTGLFAPQTAGSLGRLSVRYGQLTETYPVAATATINRDGAVTVLGGLRLGDVVSIRVEGGTITRITASSVSKQVAGTAQSVILSAVPALTFVNSAGGDETYAVSPAAVIVRSGYAMALTDIRPGYLLTVYITRSEITRIEVQVREVLSELVGEIRSINTQARTVLIALVDPLTGLPGNMTREVYIPAEAVVIKLGGIKSFGDLRTGDRLMIAGSEGAGRLTATAVVVTATTVQ